MLMMKVPQGNPVPMQRAQVTLMRWRRRRAKAATDKDQQIAHRSIFPDRRSHPGKPLVPVSSDPCKDQDGATPNEKGGSRSYRPFEIFRVRNFAS